MDPDDPRVIELGAAIKEIAPAFFPADASTYAYAYARARARTYARADAHDYARTYAYARARARIPPFLTDEQQAQIDAAHASLFD